MFEISGMDFCKSLAAVFCVCLLALGCDKEETDPKETDPQPQSAVCEGSFVVSSSADTNSITHCSSIKGDLTISVQGEPEFTSVNGLNGLRAVDGTLKIISADSLTNGFNDRNNSRSNWRRRYLKSISSKGSAPATCIKSPKAFPPEVRSSNSFVTALWTLTLGQPGARQCSVRNATWLACCAAVNLRALP